MEKSDKSIHNICIAAIKRATMKPYDFRWTRFYEKNEAFRILYPGIAIELADNELIICSTIIGEDNFSILTTRKLVTKEMGVVVSGDISTAGHSTYGSFKRSQSASPFTFGLIRLDNGNELKYFIETGIPSMVMIHGVKTSIRLQGMTAAQVEKLPGIWAKRDSINE
jgi:hypothetical protein